MCYFLLGRVVRGYMIFLEKQLSIRLAIIEFGSATLPFNSFFKCYVRVKTLALITAVIRKIQMDRKSQNLSNVRNSDRPSRSILSEHLLQRSGYIVGKTSSLLYPVMGRIYL